MRQRRLWWLLILMIPLVVVGGFVVWAHVAARPMPEALSAMASDDMVVVEAKPWLIFRPKGEAASTGLILYPGAPVNPRAYAPAAHAIATQGYLVVIVPMPFNLAVIAPDRAQEVLEAFPTVDRWAIGGHSLGGAMAARFAYRHPGAVEGLVLWAAYPADTDDLSARDLQVTSIYATNDGLSTPAKIEASRRLLPPATTWVAISGGNHAQFGWYGAQRGDLTATISRTSQQQQVVTATVALLRRLGGG